MKLEQWVIPVITGLVSFAVSWGYHVRSISRLERDQEGLARTLAETVKEAALTYARKDIIEKDLTFIREETRDIKTQLTVSAAERALTSEKIALILLKLERGRSRFSDIESVRRHNEELENQS